VDDRRGRDALERGVDTLHLVENVQRVVE